MSGTDEVFLKRCIVLDRLDHWSADAIAKHYSLSVEKVQDILAECGHERPGRRGGPKKYALNAAVADNFGLAQPDMNTCTRIVGYWLEG